jgi:hypothetical protein
MADDNKKLEILHDHYKETFSYIHEREKQRDNLFLIVIGLLGLLFLEVQYPSDIQSVLKIIKTPAAEINFSIFPVPIITSLTWTVFLIIVLRYCQVSITIERQYEYLHKLEEVIGDFFQDSIYNREGRAYLISYPIFSEVLWIFYTQLFPLLIIVLQVLIIRWEINYSVIDYHYIYDAIMGAGATLALVLYRIPQLVEAIKNKNRRSP